MGLPYYLVDVFTAVPLFRNPLAVFSYFRGSQTTFGRRQEPEVVRAIRARTTAAVVLFFNRVEIYHNRRREHD
jgi:hypothetical protein